MTAETIDFAALRKPFAAEQVGKLPRVTCKQCSNPREQCGQHKSISCPECKSWVSERHIHIDYVGHADVTSRLLEVDPGWSWAPKATDPDKELLAAAIATGNPEMVQAVIENAPPKFETNANGSPVGFWIKLTVGGLTRLGYGSVPGNQFDAEKVLIGDALRNAAMRFGVALDLWAKGERADPTAENPVASAESPSRTQARSRSNGRVVRADDNAGKQEARTAAPDLGEWGVRVDSITSPEDAADADAELRKLFLDRKIDSAKANVIRQAIKDKAAQVSRKTPEPVS